MRVPLPSSERASGGRNAPVAAGTAAQPPAGHSRSGLAQRPIIPIPAIAVCAHRRETPPAGRKPRRRGLDHRAGGAGGADQFIGLRPDKNDRICSTPIGTTGTPFRRSVRSTVVPAMLRGARDATCVCNCRCRAAHSGLQRMCLAGHRGWSWHAAVRLRRNRCATPHERQGSLVMRAPVPVEQRMSR